MNRRLMFFHSMLDRCLAHMSDAMGRWEEGLGEPELNAIHDQSGDG